MCFEWTARESRAWHTLVYSRLKISRYLLLTLLRNRGRDISFPIFTRKEIETKRIRKEIKTKISRLNHFLSFLFQYIAEKKLKQEYWKENQNKNISIYRLNISIIQHNAGLQLVDFFHQWEARNILIYRDIMSIT